MSRLLTTGAAILLAAVAYGPTTGHAQGHERRGSRPAAAASVARPSRPASAPGAIGRSFAPRALTFNPGTRAGPAFSRRIGGSFAAGATARSFTPRTLASSTARNRAPRFSSGAITPAAGVSTPAGGRRSSAFGIIGTGDRFGGRHFNSGYFGGRYPSASFYPSGYWGGGDYYGSYYAPRDYSTDLGYQDQGNLDADTPLAAPVVDSADAEGLPPLSESDQALVEQWSDYRSRHPQEFANYVASDPRLRRLMLRAGAL